MNKKQRIIAGAVAGCSVLLIVVSAFFLVGSNTDAFSGDLLQTTAPSSPEAEQRAKGQADRHASSPDAAEGAARDAAPSSEPSSADNAAAPASLGAGASGGQSSGGGSQIVTLPAKEEGSPLPPTLPATITVSVSVSSTAVGGPVSATIRPTFNQGATAYDALCATGLSVNAASSQYGVYVSAIGGLAEKEHGASSGWLYAVNGTTPGVSCSTYVLQDGDTIEWRYAI